MNIPFVDLHAQYARIKDEIDEAIRSVIADGAFIGGPYAKKFETEFSAWLGLKHTIACGNGTDSLEILMQALGIGKGDEVIVPALSWISTSEAVSAIGATPVFVDIHPQTYTLDPALIEAAISPRTKAIIPVHLYGHPAHMPEIMEIAGKYDLKVIEDCAQSHGAKIEDKLAGTWGHCASFSFYPGKNLGAYGDAGAMATNDDTLARKARMIANHGQYYTKHVHEIEGRNSRLDGIQAAILSVKLPYLETWTAERISRAEKYYQLLSGTDITPPSVGKNAKHVYHLFVVQVENRDAKMAELTAAGIQCAVHYPTPLPLLDAYKHRGYTKEDFPVAWQVTQHGISLPMYPELSDEGIVYVAGKLTKPAYV
ncbi:MAG: DegT/DnrJ/EryC1/StrS family aminotransferase [Bacteroidia bacterium]|nr:DegT/DnrJ/EryC1/StrS family aminotransferase [Bacteroidia bacterium]